MHLSLCTCHPCVADRGLVPGGMHPDIKWEFEKEKPYAAKVRTFDIRSHPLRG